MRVGGGCHALEGGGDATPPAHTPGTAQEDQGKWGMQAHIAQITYYLGQITRTPSAVQQKGAAHKTRTPAHYNTLLQTRQPPGTVHTAE